MQITYQRNRVGVKPAKPKLSDTLAIIAYPRNQNASAALSPLGGLCPADANSEIQTPDKLK